jgi:large subunit ribosomal protein L16
MLSPKRTKYRKYQKGRIGGIKSNNTQLEFGKYGLKALEAARLTAKTIEAVRRTMTRKFKRSGQIWIRIFPDIPVTKKPAEVRMGKGKGAPAFWMCRIQPGQILFEMDGISLPLAKQAAHLAYHKLPVKTKLVCADEMKDS